jgi:hypothetical protein
MAQQDPYAQELKQQRDIVNEQMANDPNAIYADSLRDDKIRNVISQIDPANLLEEIEHRIRGEKKNSFTQEWQPIDVKATPISEKLVSNYISFLGTYLTQNTSMSNYSPREINSIMEVIIDHIRDDLSDNADMYGLVKRRTVMEKMPCKKLIYTIEGNKRIVTYQEEIKEIKRILSEEVDYNEFNRIGHIICQSTFAVLKQAQNGMLAQRIFKALRVNETLGGEKKNAVEMLKFW